MRQVNRFADDALNFVGNVRARTANEIMRGFRDVQRKEAQLTLPILAMHGTADKITSYTVSEGPAQHPNEAFVLAGLLKTCLARAAGSSAVTSCNSLIKRFWGLAGDLLGGSWNRV
jgi:hypothetical protein